MDEISTVSKNFSSNRYTDLELSTKAGSIVLNMTGNEHFATPTPALEDVTAANTSYAASLEKAENGSKADTANKNNKRAALEALLKQLADYVQSASGGDEAIILSSGFEVNKKPTPVGELEKPDDFKVKMGSNKGSIVASCKVVERARFYVLEYTEDYPTDESVWTKVTSTKRKISVSNLTSGKKYSFRMAGAGSDSSRIWSNIITTFVV